MVTNGRDLIVGHECHQFETVMSLQAFEPLEAANGESDPKRNVELRYGVLQRRGLAIRIQEINEARGAGGTPVTAGVARRPIHIEYGATRQSNPNPNDSTVCVGILKCSISNPARR
jgi:hypothetical protein